MRLSIVCVLVAALFFVRAARLQAQAIDPGEANRRLAARVAARAAAATQPTTLTNAEVDALRAQIKQLEAENASLRKTLAADQAAGKGEPAVALGTTGAPGATVFKPATTFSDRAKKATAKADRRVNVKGALKRASEIDAFLNDYLAKNKVSDEIAASMWSGQPKIGMPIEVVKQIGTLRVTSEGTDTVEGEFFIEYFTEFFPVGLPGVTPVDYRVYATNGVVSRLDIPGSGSGTMGVGQRGL